MKRIWKNLFLVIGLLLLLLPANLWGQQDRVIRVAAFNYYPAIFLDSDNQVRGFYVDMLDEIAAREPIRFEYVFGSWSEGLERLRSGDVDLVTSAAYTEERATFMDYGQQALLTVWGELYLPQDSPIIPIRNLQDKRIAVMRGDHNARSFEEHLSKFGVSSQFIDYTDFDEVFDAIKDQQVSAGVVNSVFGDAAAKKYQVQSSGIAFNPFDIYFASATGQHAELLSLLDDYLYAWRNDSTSVYFQSRLAWGATQDPETVIPAWVIKLAAVAAVLLLIGLIFIVLLRYQVHRATRRLKKNEAELQKSNDMIRLLLDSTAEAIYGVDPQGICTFCNAACVRILGYDSADQIIGRNMHDLIHHFYADGTVMPATECRQLKDLDRQNHSDTEVFWRADGSSFPVECWSYPVRQEDKTLGLVVSFVDISERKKMEEEKEKLQAQLNQAQKIESVGQLAGGVAHDFNNMLGVILGYTQLAMLKIGPDKPLYANLEAIRKAAERSANLTRQLLAFARKQTVAPKVLELNETVNDMLKMLRRLIGENMDLAWRPGRNLGFVFIDPSQLDQILTNLCVNARDAIANTGQITIETASVCFDEAYCADHAGFIPGEFVMLAVSDDGCGMDADILQHIFEPFFSTKKMGKGTGLGLATVYGIVKQNNGFINVYSEPSYGTTFKIYLPQHADQAVPRSEQEPIPIAAAGCETILLVEDEPAILEMTTIMLEEMGYAVIAVGSPGAAIRLAQEHLGRIDLLMTDVIMPEMNGRDLAGNIMSIYPDIRRLFMSGYTANVIAHHGVLDTGVHFLQKPFSMKDMATKIREALERGNPTRDND